MTEFELAGIKAYLYERRPGQLLAFMPEPEAQLLAETLVAFANSDGGTILIGVDETGRAAGQVYADEVEVALRATVEKCRPPVDARWHQAAAEEGLAFAMVVARSSELQAWPTGACSSALARRTVPSAATRSANWPPPSPPAISRQN